MELMEQKMQEQMDRAMHEMKEQSSMIAEALGVIKQAMIDDNPSEPGSYAHSWHCNIAVMCMDAIRKHDTGIYRMDYTRVHKIANDAASRFMKLCFDVETKA